MSKIGIVTKFEIVRQLKKPSFWVALLLLPALIIGVIGLSALSGYSMDESIAKTVLETDDETKIGLTDKAEVVESTIYNDKIVTVEDEETGIEQVKKGELDEYYFIDSNFLETKEIKGYLRQKGETASLMFSSMMNGNISNILTVSAASRVAPADIIILSNSVSINTTTFDQNGEVANPLGKAIIPMAVLAIFYILICVFGNRMLMAVVEEKENRISEMILTAVSSKQLIMGKIIALILLGFLQMVVFMIPVIVLIFVNRDNPMISNIFGMIEFDPITLIMNVALLVFSYFLFTGACTLVGSMMPTARDASQYIGIVMVGMVLPLMFIGQIMSPEASFMTYFLSYFPLSAPIAMMLRNAFGLLPWYEFVIGVIEIGAFSAISIWLASKSFQKNAINFSLTKFSFKPRKSWKKVTD